MQLHKALSRALLISIFFLFAGCEPSQGASQSESLKVTVPEKGTPQLAKPDCKALLSDAEFLDAEYRRVRAPNYTANKQACDQTIAAIDGRFGLNWGKLRGVTPYASRGEPKVMDAARTFSATCTQIVLSFACEGPDKLKRENWPSVVDDYDWDYRRFVADLRTVCGGARTKTDRAETREGLGRTERQILAKLEAYFPRIEESTPVHDKSRRMGQASDNSAGIEIIGDPKDVNSASVMVALPNDDRAILSRNTTICFILINNALPKWSRGADWFNEAIEKIMDSPEKTSEETSVGHATVKLALMKQVGILALTIERNE